MKGIAVVALLLLAGCIGPPDVPDDAVVATDPDLPGLTLSAWTEMSGGRLRMQAFLENDGPHSYDIHVGCGAPWDSKILGPQGEIGYREVLEEPGCPTYWDVLRPKADLEALYSWNFEDHDVEAETHEPVPPGTYEWILRFDLRDRDDYLETRIPIIVPGPLDDFEMTLTPREVEGGYAVDVTVSNDGSDGPDFWTGCGMEWDWRILQAGEEVPLEPVGSCDGFQETTFPPGHEVQATFTWNGMVWNGTGNAPAAPGDYEWEVTFGLQGTSGETLSERVGFVV